MKLYIFLGNCFLYFNRFPFQLFSSWFFFSLNSVIINGCSTNVLGKSSFKNHVFWIRKYLKDIFLFFSQQLPSFPKLTLFHATALDTLEQNSALKISKWRSLLQCGHHFYHTALSLKNQTVIFFFKSGIQELWNELWIDTDVVCLSGACVVVAESSANQLSLQKTCGVPSKRKEGFACQTIFKTFLHRCWRDAEVVPHNITPQQEKPQLTQRQTTGEMK